MMRALLVPADPALPVRMIDIDATDHAKVAAAIGCEWIEMVRTRHPALELVVDEVGRLDGRAVNRRLSGVLYPGAICGDALIVGAQRGPDGGRGWCDLIDVHELFLPAALIPEHGIR